MTFVATRDSTQVFVIQPAGIEKYKQKWLDTVAKYSEEILPENEASKVEMEGVDGDTIKK